MIYIHNNPVESGLVEKAVNYFNIAVHMIIYEKEKDY